MSSFNRCSALRALSLAALIAGAGLLAACGYRPLYGTSGLTEPASATATAELTATEVARISSRSGQMLRNALERRLHIPRQSGTRYRLTVVYHESKQTLAEQKSGAVTRANLRTQGAYRLTRISDGMLLNKGRSDAVASYNLLDSEFATLAAEKDARTRAIETLADDIRTRLAIYFSGPGSQGQPTRYEDEPQ